MLKHEICYCLGQMDKSEAHNVLIQAFLERIIFEDHASIVVHEVSHDRRTP